MRILLFFILILILGGCTTVKVAKEVTKATNSIKTSVDNLINKKQKSEEQDGSVVKNIDIDLKNLEKEKEEVKKLVSSQKKIIKVNFVGKTLNELKSKLGEESLNRFDGNTQIVRFDISTCKLFLFFNPNLSVPRVEHYEIRNKLGNLETSKDKIQSCYRNYDLS